MEELIEIVEHNGEDYKTLVAFEGWRVAILNFADKFIRENIPFLEKHELTDEVFVLLGGEATLYIAGGKDMPDPIQQVKMEPNKIYNIKKGVWHNLEVSPDGHLLIVENKNTTRGNSPTYAITPDMLPE